jgi:glycosyltransferase involved in cell wall biosynthesis
MSKSKNSIHKSIIYVNFAPYENAGKILDYIIEKFDLVIIFSFNFHKLTNNNEPSILKVLKNGKTISKHSLYYLPTPRNLAFILLPIRSLIIFLQLIYHTIRLKQVYGIIDTYFTVNAFTAWCGVNLKKLGLIKHTIFWVWDYYPPVHSNIIVKIMRKLYWHYDKSATINSDHVVFLNQRLEFLRKKSGLLDKNIKYPVAQIGTDPVSDVKMKKLKEIKMVFLGVVKRSQGLDLFYDSAEKLKSKFPNISLAIIGSGPDEEYFHIRSNNCGIPVKFYGYLENDKYIDLIINSCHIGLATYIHEESNVSYYSDPSKIKRYLSQGLPIITTNVFDFSKDIKQNSAGIIINYNPIELINAIDTIIRSYRMYQLNSLKLAKLYNYKHLYQYLFN